MKGYPSKNDLLKKECNRMPAIDEAMTKTLSDKDTMNRLIQRSCEADYKRMGFVGIAGAKFRMSRVNRLFSVCRR